MKVFIIDGPELAELLAAIKRRANHEIEALRIKPREDGVELKIDGAVWTPTIGRVETDTDNRAALRQIANYRGKAIRIQGCAGIHAQNDKERILCLPDRWINDTYDTAEDVTCKRCLRLLAVPVTASDHEIMPASDNPGLCGTCRLPVWHNSTMTLYKHADSPVMRRVSLLRTVRHFADNNRWHEAYDIVAKVGPPLGTTEQWLDAVEWFVNSKEAGHTTEWIVTHGIILLATYA